MQGILENFNTQLPEVAWPRFLPPYGASLLAMVYQLEKSPYFSGEWQRQQQLRQASQLLRHAWNTVPYYRETIPRECLAPELSWETWRRVPVLPRKEVQQAGDALISRKLPAGHGELRKVSTSGSTGMPVTCYGTDVTHLVWMASSLMEHFWHRRDVSCRHLTIRPIDKLQPGEISRSETWAPPVRTGPSVVASVRADIGFQLQVLQRENPGYLLSLPSNLRALAEACRQEGVSLPGLKGVRSYGEVLTPEIRQYCEETWGGVMTDVYSSQEVGNLALQCPEGQLHVFTDGVLLELLREDGTPCEPGETGQVVVTTLVNFGCPLIRYALGDYAELGEGCTCGRNTPVLKQVHGRQRNMLHLPGGGRSWPSFPASVLVGDLPISQFQLIQKSLDTIAVRLVVTRPLTSPEEERLVATVQDRLSYPFRVVFAYVAEIPRSKSGKFEDFMSEVG